MAQLFDIGIFGGDLRQVYMAMSFLSKGYRVTTYNLAETISHTNHSPAHTLSELFENCTILIGPIPMSRDQATISSVNAPNDLTIAHVAYLLKEQHSLIGGNIPIPIKELCETRHIPYFDLMRNEKITILNAIATAEGTIMEAIANSSRNLHGSNCLILGYGRCAKVLADKLKGLDAMVTIAARSEDALAYAYAAGHKIVSIANMKCILPSYSFIFNTIPSLILDKDYLELVDRNATIIDIASAPGGIDFEYAKQLHITAKLCLGLPGKVSPKSSADILVTEIIKFMKERSD
ncbi:dipicolinate synthase subunit DpsA [Mobilitalea sibirica]|uniref:Dipicolinate synthase subunit DpsA n=1 Tax=Mobilitalea sibirica TaxID=1462919 RepID=A0A8J7GWT2_9FIRM|nr:dipicolinate synthase subunit DpsA [Mobilitalea sibirica]MBH1939354.1 dipicolinate synthase subunit DpsA [Mobilitalea sibirica]